MKTSHTVLFKNSKRMSALQSGTIDLVVTSPPYPMIEMWDDIFDNHNKKIGKALQNRDPFVAFELMHQELDKVWDELFRVLKPGGIACINIGDATRTINDHFALYTNHSRIHTYMQKIGFSALPSILWRKQTNAPNKFMGSGMMPPGAYVTLEHEYVLILRKGNKKEFTSDSEKRNRRESSFFWEERNIWFSDVWTDLKGASQTLVDNGMRERSAAFPFELPYRLINMFSVKSDIVLDPFLGSGTTMFAAIAASRNSIGYEMDPTFNDYITSKSSGIVDFCNKRIKNRLETHINFVEKRYSDKGKFKYINDYYRFPVITRQETSLLLNELTTVEKIDKASFAATYSEVPQEAYIRRWEDYVFSVAEIREIKSRTAIQKLRKAPKQKQLFE